MKEATEQFFRRINLLQKIAYMKRTFQVTAFALIVLGSTIPSTTSAQYNGGYNNDYNNSDYNPGYHDRNGDRDVSYQTFYDELSPHGRWVEYPGHGFVWIPNAGPDFRPYSSNGHWVYSEDYEWTWVSDYDWGWAPFHYGRWDSDPSYGWYWVPGYEWSPAWVAWRDGGDYYGWAPIRPGINININYNIGGYAPPVDFWSFAPRRYITSPHLYNHCLDRRQNVTVIHYTTVIVNNYRYGGDYGFRSGPRRYEAERYTGRINPVRFRQSYSPGRTTFRNNEVIVYRPNIRRDNNRSFAPRSFERYDRNSNNGFRNNDAVRRNENTPGRVGLNDNNRFERRDINQDRFGTNDNRLERRTDDVRQPPTNDNNPGNRRFERNENNQPGRNDERRFRTPDQPVRNPNSGNTENRRFERRSGNETDFPPPQQLERRQAQQQQQVERRQPQPQRQQQPEQFERRPPEQVERRQEPRPQVQQEQQPTRRIERRENVQGDGNGPGRSRL